MKRTWDSKQQAHPKKVKHAKMKPYNRKDSLNPCYTGIYSTSLQ